MLKRIARYLGAQEWNAIAIEFVIVTAGVLMGIQVSNWNDDRLEKARIHAQLTSLRTELNGNLATIRDYQKYVESQLGDVLALERTFDRPGHNNVMIDRKLMNVFRVRSMILETNAYDELNEMGGFRYMPADIRSAMTEWQARKGQVERVDQDALSYRIGVIDQLFGTLAFEPMVRNLAPSFEPAGNAPVRNGAARLAKDAQIRNYLAMRYGIETQKLQFARDLERATENLVALLGKSEA
jgi:hypothetical protein